jgi:hypothetical protein
MSEIIPHQKKCCLAKAGLNAHTAMAAGKANKNITIRPNKSYFANTTS